MMQEVTTQFDSLKKLQSKLQSSDSFVDVDAAAHQFLQETQLGDWLMVLPTAVLPPSPATPIQFQKTLANHAYQLVVGCAVAFDETETAVLQMMVALLATAPFFAQAGQQTTPKQQALLEDVSHSIAVQRRYRVLVELLEEAYPLAFPHSGAQLLLWSADNSFNPMHDPWGSVPLERLPEMDEPTMALLLAGKTAVLPQASGVHLLLPMQYGNEKQALLHVTSAEMPSATTVSALTMLAGYLSIGLGNSVIVEQAWQRANQLETIYRVTESARVLRPLAPTLVEIHKQLLRAFNAPTCFIALVDADSDQVIFPCVWDDDQPASWSPLSLRHKDSLVAWVINNNLPFATDNWDEEQPFVEGIKSDAKSHSIICVPMRVQEEVLGAISIQHQKVAAFNASDYQTLVAVAAHAGAIIKNAQLYATARELVDKGTRDYQTAVALRQAIAAISASLVQDEVARQLLGALKKVLNYSNAWVFLRADDAWRYVAGRNFYERPLGVAAQVFQQAWQDSALLTAVAHGREPLCLPDVWQDDRWPDYPSGNRVRTWLGTPLLAGERVVGILMVDSERVNAFDTHEEWLVSSLAAHAGVAVQNALLYQQTQEQLSELETLYQASATMTSNLDQQAVLQTVADEMVYALQVDTCTIFVWDNVRQQLEPAVNKSTMGDMAADDDGSAIGLNAVDDLTDNSLVRQILQTRQMMSLRADGDSEADGQLLAVAGLQSLLLVPLVRHKTLLGLLALGQLHQPRTYSDRELRLAQNLAGQAAVAIEHARLFGQAQRRVAELSAFHDIVLQLNTPLRLNEVLDSITQSALKLIGATNLHIYLYDAQTKKFTKGSALWRDGRRTAAVKKLRSNGLTVSVVESGQPIVINDASAHDLFQSAEAQAWGIYAIAGFPLKHGDEIIGAFTVTYLDPHTFSEDELLLLNLLAEQAAVAVWNASLFADSQRRLLDMSALVDMAKQINGDLNLQSVLLTTVQILRQLLNARASTVTMLTDDKAALNVRAADGIKEAFANMRMELGDSISGRAVHDMSWQYVSDTQEDDSFVFFDEAVRSLLVVPLIIRDEAVGTLTVDSDKPYAFSQSDVQLMMIAAAQVSVAIANARLFEALEARAGELKRAYDELKESDRLKDELVQNVSHELRTPLTFVKGYVDLLLDGEMGLLTTDQQGALEIIADKTNDITRIIEDIVTMQKINPANLKSEQASMADVVKTAVSGHQLIAANKGLRINCELPQQKGMVIIDKGRINQVLNNLIGNAMKFSPDGGTITVSMSEQSHNVLVAVIDEGIGIPPEKQGRIFERFYQIDGSASRRFGGTGIGLAIVKRIIDAHHGKIWVESEVNKGSKFYFLIPKADTTLAELVDG